MASTSFTGPVRSGNAETDGQIFIPGSLFQFNVGAWTLTRGAAGNYFMRKAAAADTSNPSVNLADLLFKRIGADPNLGGNKPGITRDVNGNNRLRGFRINALSVVYAIGTAAITTHTYDLHRTTYANNTAPAVDSTIGGTLTGTLATATQTQPYVTEITVGTPFVVGSNSTLVTDWFELTVAAAGTSVYDLYGMFVNFDTQIL